MSMLNNIKEMYGTVTVQIEGFFTERFINLCKINNIKIWNITTVVKGVVRFNINISDFKYLRKFAKKTKCKITIKDKRGIYFKLFKYRKRKIFFLLFLLLLFFSIFLSTFILRIDVEGNDKIESKQVIEALKNSGLYIGKNKLFFNKKETINLLRLNLPDVSWTGIDINGTNATVKIVEKVRLDENNVQNSTNGDIVASKEGIITKIVAENGTAKFKTGSYINKNDVAIEGKIYSMFMPTQSVPAKGIVQIESHYVYNNKYTYVVNEKEYTNKKLYTIGISINSKENMLNYLNKNKKYDITKNSKKIVIFGKEISFDIYKCLEYNDISKKYSKDDLILIAKENGKKYLNDAVLKECINGKLVDEKMDVEDNDDGINVKITYTVNEEVGKFVSEEES